MNAKEKSFIQIQSKIEKLKKAKKTPEIQKKIFELNSKLNVLKLEIKPIDEQIKEKMKVDKTIKLYNNTALRTFELFFDNFIDFKKITGNKNEFFQFELIKNIIINQPVELYIIIYSKNFTNLGGSFINLYSFVDNYFNLYTDKNIIFKYSNLKSMIHCKLPLIIDWNDFLLIRKKVLNLQKELKL